MRRHKCRKSGQYGYLYSASLSSRGISSWVFSMSNKTHESRRSRYPFSKNDPRGKNELPSHSLPRMGFSRRTTIFCPAALNGGARISHTNGGAQVWSCTKSPIKPCCLSHLRLVPIKQRLSRQPDEKQITDLIGFPCAAQSEPSAFLLVVKIYPTRNHLQVVEQANYIPRTNHHNLTQTWRRDTSANVVSESQLGAKSRGQGPQLIRAVSTGLTRGC